MNAIIKYLKGDNMKANEYMICYLIFTGFAFGSLFVSCLALFTLAFYC